MAVIVLVIGESGTENLRVYGTSKRRGFDSKCIKSLPFKKWFKDVKKRHHKEIETILKKSDPKSIIIDDAQYLMAFEYMHRAKEKGFEKFTDIGSNFFNLTQTAIGLSDDKIHTFFIPRWADKRRKWKV